MGLLYMNAWILPIQGPTNESCPASDLGGTPRARAKKLRAPKASGPVSDSSRVFVGDWLKLDHLYGLPALGSAGHLELHLGAFVQGPVAFVLNGCVMDEDVLP